MNSVHNKYFGIYIRVSTEEQARSKEGSLVSQEQRCRDYLSFQYQPHEKREVILYKEEPLSAKNTDRPVFQQMLADIELGIIDAVCCTELSRLSRSTVDFINFVEFCNKHEVSIHCMNPRIETHTSYGKFVATIFASMAQFEREQISERTSANMQARARRGLFNGGYIYGYRSTPGKTGHLDIDENEATIVRLMFAKYTEIGSYCLLAKWLNAQGYRTREYKTKSGKIRTASLWKKSSVMQCLSNEMYIGKRILKDGSIVDGIWKPIVTTNLWQKVQELLGKNMKKRKNSKALLSYTYLFSGLIECAHCGLTLESGSGTSRNGERHFYYRHPSSKRKPDCIYPTSIVANELEKHIFGHLATAFDDSQLIQITLKKANLLLKEQAEAMESEIQTISKQIKNIENEILAILKKLPVLEDEYIKEETQPMLREMIENKKQLIERKEFVNVELLRINRDSVTEEEIQKIFSIFLKNFSVLSLQEKKEIIQEMVDKVELTREKIVVKIRIYGENNIGSKEVRTGSPPITSKRTSQPLIFSIPIYLN